MSTRQSSKSSNVPTLVPIELHETARIDNKIHTTDHSDDVGGIKLSKLVYLRLASASLSFFCAGVNDGSLGSLIPYILRDYEISTDLVAVIYGTTFAGWLVTALINSYLCQFLDLGAILALGAGFQLLAQALRTWFPPFPLYTVTFFLQSLGLALQDTHSNTYVASVKGAHRWLALIHAMYALGMTIAPFVATSVASADMPSRWYLFYIFAAGVGVLNLGLVFVAFRDTIRLKPSSSDDSMTTGRTSRNKDATREFVTTLKTSQVWLLSMFFFFFLGSGITAGGWVVEYLIDVRDGNPSSMGYVPAGFNGGVFLGRLLLAEPTKRFGERKMVFIYSVLCLVMQLVFWLVPSIVAGAVSISIFGFFFGPLFATGVSVGTQIFPQAIKSSALAFVFVIGQVGGSVFPAITGVVATRAGVKVLQPILVALLSATIVSWLLVPRINLRHE